jgi:transcriptional regulator with XRE-family HTH domain
VADFNQTERFLRNRLRLLRKSVGLTQESVSELAGISSIFYQSIEAGRRPNVSLRTIDKISRAYGLTIHELFAPQIPKVPMSTRNEVVPLLFLTSVIETLFLTLTPNPIVKRIVEVKSDNPSDVGLVSFKMSHSSIG